MGSKNQRITAEEPEIIRLYREGLSTRVIAKRFGIVKTSVLRILKRNSETPRHSGRSCWRQVDHASFADPLSPDAAYWIGFLMADGNIGDSFKTPQLNVGLKIGDISHLYKLQRFLKAEHAVVDRGFKCTFAASSLQICDDLGRHGVVPRKCHMCRFELLSTNADAWRGLVDGDGCVGFAKRKDNPHIIAAFSLVGSRVMMEQFSDFIVTSFGWNWPKPAKSRNSWSHGFLANKAKAIVRLLYSTGGISLDRKQRIANVIMAM